MNFIHFWLLEFNILLNNASQETKHSLTGNYIRYSFNNAIIPRKKVISDVSYFQETD